RLRWVVVIALLLPLAVTASCLNRNEDASSKSEALSEDELSAKEIWDLVVEFHKATAIKHKRQVQDAFYTLVGKLHDRGRLKAVLKFVVAGAHERFGVDALAALTEQEREDLVTQIETAISAEIEKRDPANN